MNYASPFPLNLLDTSIAGASGNTILPLACEIPATHPSAYPKSPEHVVEGAMKRSIKPGSRICYFVEE